MINTESARDDSEEPIPFPATTAFPRRIRDLPEDERPQEKIERYGVGALTDKELIAMILRSGGKGRDVLTIAGEILEVAGGLGGLVRWTPEEFQRIHGIGRVKALQLVTVLEMHRRCLVEAGNEAPVLRDPETVFRHMKPVCHLLEVEKFYTLCLNRKHRLLKRVEVSSGTATASLAHPREVFREAIRANAAAIIVSHNHPSGDPTPSQADIQVTRQLRDAAKHIGIELLDHIIVGRDSADPRGLGYYSFNDAGLI